MEPSSAIRLPENAEVVPLRHLGRWSSAVVVLVLLGALVWQMATVSEIHYDAIPHYLFDSQVLKGVVLTVELAVLAQAIGIALGVVLAVARLSRNPVLSSLSWGYIWLFRGTPLIVQILFWYNGTLLVFPRIDLHIPLVHLTLVDVPTSTVMTLFTASLVSLALNEAAYMAEIVRGGILSIDVGQLEAAQSIGLKRMEALRAVVLPQALRVIIPPTGNEFLSMIKNTSLISIIAGGELLTNVRDIYSTNSLVFELLAVACLWYLFLTSIAYIGQYFIERRFGRGFLSVASSGRVGR